MPKIENMMLDLQNNYHLSNSITQIEYDLEKMRMLDQMMLNQPEKKQSSAAKYLKTVDTIVSQHIEYTTAFGTQADVKNLNVSVRNLVRDYENLMKARHEEAHPGEPRTPYEGIHGRVMDTIAKYATPDNLPLHEVWAKRIMNKSFDIADVRARANAIFENSQEGDLTAEATQRSVKDAILMHRAIQEVSSQRSAFWAIWPWNWRQAYHESKLLDELTAHVAQYEQRGIRAATVLSENSAPIFGEYFDNIISNEKAFFVSEMQNPSNYIDPNAREPLGAVDITNTNTMERTSSAAKVPVSETIMKWAADFEAVDNMIVELSESLPKSVAVGRTKPLIRSNLEQSLVKPVKDASVKYDKHDGTEKDVMKKLINTLYKNALDLAHKCGFLKPASQIAAAQIFVDKMMSKLSPASVDPELAEFKQGYILKNAKEINAEMPSIYQFTEAQYADANNVYLETVPQKLDMSNMETVQVTELSPPATQAPTIQAPTNSIN